MNNQLLRCLSSIIIFCLPLFALPADLSRTIEIEYQLYLPLILTPYSAPEENITRRVNAPLLDEPYLTQSAILWFGQVNSTDNYVDARISYTEKLLNIRLAAFDRYAWYDTNPSTEDLTAWDSASLYLELDDHRSKMPISTSFQFVGQLNWWETRENYQAAYRGNGSSWSPVTIPFTTTTGMRGVVWNDNTEDDRGWTIKYEIPFTSLGLSGPPDEGSIWGLAIILHDRDDIIGTSIPNQFWPENANGEQPNTWGQLRFGMPTYIPPTSFLNSSLTIIRNNLDGVIVRDVAAGGGTICGDGLDFWNEWGNTNYANMAYFNIQNQADVADWPCFSKYYITFPLDTIPIGKIIISATLTLYEFGGSDPSQAVSSLIQVLTLSEDWEETTLSWNNAPLAFENVSQAWVEPLEGFPGWPGVPWTWDLSSAVVDAYQARIPLRLVLYSSDSAPHSGKYFSSSDTEDWNELARPTLTIQWREP